MPTRADHLDPVGTILSTHLVILPDPATGKLYRSTVGALLAMVAAPDLSLKADLVSGKVPASQLPSYVDDVLEFDTVALLPIIGETGKLYVITTGADAEDVFRWTGTVYLQVGGRDFGVDISTEASTRAAADIALQNNIDAEATTRAAADTTLQTNITTEASTRAAADTTLQNNIDTEALARGNQDTVLLGLINAEANTRSTNDNTLSSNISSEATARAAADIILQTNIDTKADLVSGKVPSTQLPSYVDDVLEFANLAAFPGTGETGKIYIDIATSLTYRWSGSVYVQVGGGAIPDATTIVKGIVKLAGDLGGTADLPTVPGLALVAAQVGAVQVGNNLFNYFNFK